MKTIRRIRKPRPEPPKDHPPRGEAHAIFEEVVQQEYPTLLHQAAKYVGKQNAKDLVQEAITQAWTKIDSLKDISKLAHYLSVTIRHTFINQGRKKEVSTVSLPFSDSIAERSTDTDSIEFAESLVEKLLVEFQDRNAILRFLGLWLLCDGKKECIQEQLGAGDRYSDRTIQILRDHISENGSILQKCPPT